GDDRGVHTHAPENAHRECDFLRGVSLVEMDAALHSRNCDVARIPDYHLSRVADRGRPREAGNLRIRDAGSVGERVGEGAQTRTQDQSDARAQLRLRIQELSCRIGAIECVVCGHSVLASYELPATGFEPRARSKLFLTISRQPPAISSR